MTGGITKRSRTGHCSRNAHDRRIRRMCGIAGVIASEPVPIEAVLRMRDELAHRGPDHAGFWSSEDRRVCLGHRRLAIVDLTPEANQPFVAGDARYVITFN